MRPVRKVETVVADLNNSEDLRRVEAVLRTDDRITLLVNNAGIGAAGARCCRPMSTRWRR